MSSRPAPSSRVGLRGLAVACLLLLAAVAVLDVLRADSVLRAIWDGIFGPRSFWRGFLRDLERSWPRW